MTKILTLQSKRVFNEYAIMNKDNGELKFYFKTKHSIQFSSMNGYYEQVDEKFCILFKHNQELYLKIDTELFYITDEVTSKFKKGKKQNIFELRRKNHLIINVVYKTPLPEIPIPLHLALTPFAEYEDFDFFCFTHNVLSENGRRQRVFAN